MQLKNHVTAVFITNGAVARSVNYTSSKRLVTHTDSL